MVTGNDLFFLMFSLSQSKDEDVIKQKFIEAINSLSESFSWFIAHEPNSNTSIKVAAGQLFFGYLNLTEDSSKPDSVSLSNISNAAALLAVLLQNAIQSKQLQQQNTALLSEINEQNTFLQNLILTIPSGLFLYNIETASVEVLNPRYEAITEYPAYEIQSMGSAFMHRVIHPDDLDELITQQQSLLQEADNSFMDSRFRIIAKSGAIKWIHMHDIPFKRSESGELVSVLGVVNDITEEIRFTRQLEDSLNEKQVLIREIHHRVKNNLQIVSSLLTLQASSIDDAAYVSFFDDCRSRIMSMAHVHQQLYQSANLHNINFDNYIHDLVDDVQKSFATEDRAIRITVTCADIVLPIDRAIPLGLIINEFLLNSFKHAFTNVPDPSVTISMKNISGQSILEYTDNGIGYDECHNNATVPGLGLDLVNNLVVQMRGTITHDNDAGTRYTVQFPA